MKYKSNTELFQKVSYELYENPQYKCSPRNLYIHENLCFSGIIKNPIDRLIFDKNRKWDIVYALGETLWYLNGSNSLDFIQYYANRYNKFSDNNKTLYGAYGTRIFRSFLKLFKTNQIYNIVKKLKKDNDTRQAVLLIWNNNDINKFNTKDLPCTIYLQYFIRNNKLVASTNMRSNDIWLGTPNDIFAFTFIQEYIARLLEIEPGDYIHNVGSIHLYEDNMQKIKNLLLCNSISMNNMPNSFCNELKELLYFEKYIRKNYKLVGSINEKVTSRILLNINDNINERFNILSQYTKDLIYVLIYGAIRKKWKNKDNNFFDHWLKTILNSIKDQAIIQCIKNYQEVDNANS